MKPDRFAAQTHPATGQIHYFSKTHNPTLVILESNDATRRVSFSKQGESRWLAEVPHLPLTGDWRFRIDSDDGTPQGKTYTTSLRTLWLQDQQIFDYPPAPSVSASQVIKTKIASGNLSARALYIYLPRGYKQHTDKHYPVLYMHDGQNCFETFVEDSYVGSWKADETADDLIGQGRMRECIIVAVSNGAEQRIAEYLPPYVCCNLEQLAEFRAVHKQRKLDLDLPQREPIIGRADQTFAFYRDDVARYVRNHYRDLVGRENVATCGSSMGALFSMYIAWEHPEFACQHAVLSPSFAITRDENGVMQTIERLRNGKPRALRLWLDSGTLTTPDGGDDGVQETRKARDALLASGFVEGQDFRYVEDAGAIHHESAWAARLPAVFQFLFPINDPT